MNIALISGNFLNKKGGISTTLENLYDKLTELGENIHIIDNSAITKENITIIHSKEKLTSLFIQNIGFYIFLIHFFFRILILENLKFKESLKIAFYYCFYPKDLVNRIKSIKNLIYYFKKINVDIILCISSSFPLFYGFILSKIFKKPLVTLAHGEDFIRRYPYNINTTIFQNIEKIIVSNMIMKKLFLKVHNVREEKVKIVYRGVNIEKVNIEDSKAELRKKLNINHDDFIILTVSRIHPRKGINTVINAIKAIEKENIDIPIKYYIIGKGTEFERLKELVQKLKLENFVIFLGEINDEIRNQYYKLSDLFILIPEIRKDSIEGFGIVFIEANYFKLPVIGTKSGGVKMAIDNGKTGFLINSGDYESLKEKIMLLYNNNQLREQLGENGYNRVLEYFDWKKIAIIYQNILKKTIHQFKFKLVIY